MMDLKKAVLHGAGYLRIESDTLNADTLDSGSILVRTNVTGFSTGTDLGNYQGRSTELPGAPEYPRAVGYSNVGTVVATGPGVNSIHPGDHVFSLKPHQSAYIASAEDILIPIPENTDLEQAALAYLAFLGLAALRRTNYQAGENVAVIGLGVIGLCTVAVAKSIGASVLAVANDDRRAQLARALGADEVQISGLFEPAASFAHQGADIVVLTANAWSAYRDAMEMTCRFGRVSVLGFPGRSEPTPGFNPLDPRWLYGKQLAIVGAGHLPPTSASTSELSVDLRRNLVFLLHSIASGTLDLSRIISHRFHYSRMHEAYELASQHSKQMTAAIFQWD
jgi:threonine dehydrogenase-like Zn-dependent dehydrogenase